MLAPLPAIVVVFVQRMKASGLKLKETCCGIGWGFAEWFLYIVWAHLLYILLFFQAHVLFLLEIDNLAFLHGLGERTRMEAEEMTGARVTEDELQTINAAKIVCILGVPGVVLAGLLGGRYVLKNQPGQLCFLTAPLPFMVILFLQRVKANRSKLKGSCGALGWGLAGYIMNLLWYLLVVILVFGRS